MRLTSRAELLRADRDDIACLVRETHTRRAAIGHGREHRSEQKNKSIWIGVVRANGLRDEIARVATDLGHRRAAIEPEAILTLDHERDRRLPHVVERECRVEEAQEGSDCATRILVLRLAKQKRRAPLEIAQIDIVGERRADDCAAGGDRERDFGFGVVPKRVAVESASSPDPTADIGWLLVNTSASAPMPTSRYCDQAPALTSASLSRIAAGEPGLSVLRSSPRTLTISSRAFAAPSRLPRARSSITRSSSDCAKVTPAALIACRSMGASKRVLFGPPLSRGVWARMSLSAPTGGPSAARSASAGEGVSQRSRMVGNAALMSKTPCFLIATTEGPLRLGAKHEPPERQRSRPRAASSLRAS